MPTLDSSPSVPGSTHTCGIKADGRVACWGSNNSGEANPTSSPQGVDADTRFLALSAGGFHTCGIKADGRAACWGFNATGQTNPPSDSFSRTPDVFRLAELSTTLATRDGGEAVQFNEVTEVEVLHPRLTIGEGTTVTLALFRALSDLATPVSVTLTIGEPDKEFLSVSPTQFTIGEKGGTATATVAAPDNDEFAAIDPIDIGLSVTGPNTRLTPTETIAAIVENDDVYTIGFDREAIALEEGMSATVRLSITPTPSGADTVTVALPVSDRGQIAAEPEEVVFSASGASFDVAVSVTEDAIPELRDTFTVDIVPQEGVAARTSPLSVIVPTDRDAIVRARAERGLIPEGMAALVFIDADLNHELSINMSASGSAADRGGVTLSRPSLTLSPDNPSASFIVSVKDNNEPQAADGTSTSIWTPSSPPGPICPP